jgi:hypothetical protein
MPTGADHDARTQAVIEQAKRRAGTHTRVQSLPPEMAALIVEMSDALDRIKMECIELKREQADTTARLERMERVTGNDLFKVSAA